MVVRPDAQGWYKAEDLLRAHPTRRAAYPSREEMLWLLIYTCERMLNRGRKEYNVGALDFWMRFMSARDRRYLGLARGSTALLEHRAYSLIEEAERERGIHYAFDPEAPTDLERKRETTFLRRAYRKRQAVA